jgi:hypothetical protein
MLDGGAGADELWGGNGNDDLWGGVGSDDFYFNDGDGHDKIKDGYDGESVFFKTKLADSNNDGYINAGSDDIFQYQGGSVEINGGDIDDLKLVGKSDGYWQYEMIA